jgi:hypothetical protein
MAEDIIDPILQLVTYLTTNQLPWPHPFFVQLHHNYFDAPGQGHQQNNSKNNDSINSAVFSTLIELSSAWLDLYGSVKLAFAGTTQTSDS